MVCCTRLKTVNLMALGPERKSTMNTKDTVITASATAAGLSGIGIGAYYLKSRPRLHERHLLQEEAHGEGHPGARHYHRSLLPDHH